MSVRDADEILNTTNISTSTTLRLSNLEAKVVQMVAFLNNLQDQVNVLQTMFEDINCKFRFKG